MRLRTRFALWVSLLVLAVLAGFSGAVYAGVASWLARSVDDSLRLSATQVIEIIDVDHGRIDLSDDLSSEDSRLADELRARGVSVQVFAADGSTIRSVGAYRGIELDPTARDAALAGNSVIVTRQDPSGSGSVRVYTQPVLQDGESVGIVQISESLQESRDILNGLLTAVGVASPIIVLAAGFGGYLLAGRALAPIDQIIRTANRISAEDLSRRLDLPASGDEVGRLAATVDGMLARLEASFRRERQFTSDAAHQLRTPLAAMQAILDVTAQKRRTPGEYEAALADLAEETARLGVLTQDLLRLARAEQPPSATDRVDLGTLLIDVADSVRQLAEAKGLDLRCSPAGGLEIEADADALARMFVNLLENAVAYTPTGSITVSTSPGDDEVRVTVADTGTGIDPEDTPHVFERFYRADPSGPVPGTGLGLAIAEEIARGHGGAISVRSTPGVGSEFEVTLPRHRSVPLTTS